MTKTMRSRLLGAVRALVGDPALDGALDSVRLGAVVLMAKADARRDFRTSIWAEELGRWLGVSRSSVAHTVLPRLREAQVLDSEVVTNEQGHPTGLDCLIVPMHRAQQARDRQHPLALSRQELAVLLRLCEVLFGPGWTPRGKEPVPAGMLAGRTGRGASTDRLGLLLMVLSTGKRGWLQLCPGTVNTGRGRPAATVARLLGCTPEAGGKVLSRLREHGVVEVVRRETASRLNHASRVRLVPVAEAHGHGPVPVPPKGLGERARSVLSDLAGSALGDLGPDQPAPPPGRTGHSLDADGCTAGTADLAGSAQHHAGHASVVDEVNETAAGLGCSGEGRRGTGDRPERAGAREDEPAAGREVPRLTLVAGAGSPLRGEQPGHSAVDEQGRPPADSGASGSPRGGGPGAGQLGPGRVPRPPRDLKEVLAPVELLWARLDRPGARSTVAAAVRAELEVVAGQTGPAYARGVLARRLARRLTDQGGPGKVRDAVGWLIRRGLPRRPDCTDVRCDEGLRLDSGGLCETCAYRVADRRALRRRIEADVDAGMPGAPLAERRVAVEERLRAAVAREAEQARVRHARAAAERAARQAAIAQVRADAEAAERARRAVPCAGCGAPDAAGLCTACATWRTTEGEIRAAALTAAAAQADVDDLGDVARVVAQAESALRREVEEASARVRADGATRDEAASLARLIAETAVFTRRRSAVALLARSEVATAEADLAFAARMRSAHRYRTRADAERAAAEAAEQARDRTARYLLAERLSVLRARWNSADAAPTHERRRPA
ncbi:hypothetical protein ACF09G_32185 [Streptomyces albogriseolus]|uniref:hypothetical protein n=1 Tax=Streptomyces albogriseolus TaxID=1887 RepID=UPI00199BDDB1|nr:hypothetical protein [Streptomyces sp.]